MFAQILLLVLSKPECLQEFLRIHLVFKDPLYEKPKVDRKKERKNFKNIRKDFFLDFKYESIS